MITKYRYTIMEWECCGLVWQLQMPIYYMIQRRDWYPVCPKCGEKGKSYSEYLKENFSG